MSRQASQSPWLERAAVVVMPWPLHVPAAIAAAAPLEPQLVPAAALLASWLHTPSLEAAIAAAPLAPWLHRPSLEAVTAAAPLALQAAPAAGARTARAWC